MSILNAKSIAISNNEQNFCFNPMTVAIGEFNVVCWCYGNNEYTDLYISVFYNKQLQVTKLLLKLTGDITLTSMVKYTEDSVGIFVTGETQCVYIVDINRTQIINTFYPEDNNDDILHVCVDRENQYTYLSCYDYENDMLNIHQYNEDNVIQNTYILDVDSCPQILVEDNRIVIGYINNDQSLVVSYLELDNLEEGFNRNLYINNYDIDYLCMCRYDNNKIVFGGLNSRSNIIRLDMVDINTDTIVSKYIKSNEYKGLEIQFNRLGDKGFMITADCEKQENIFIQRFTHIGSWLYSMTRISDNGTLWSPSFSSDNHSLIVYIKDYDSHSCVEGKWVQIGEIPELDQYFAF
jgi:hypothetical protein